MTRSEINWDNPDALWEYYLEDVDFGGNTVLDPFMGGGTTIGESLRTNCNVIGSELNPVAWFIVKKQIEPAELDELNDAYNKIYQSVGKSDIEENESRVETDKKLGILDYYKTSCPHHDGLADAMYHFWVKELKCMNCGHEVPLFKNYYLADSRSKSDDYKNVVCPDCWTVQQADSKDAETMCVDENCNCEFIPTQGNVGGGDYTCPECGVNSNVIDATERYGMPNLKMYATEYYCESCDEKGYKSIENYDIELYQRASRKLKQERDELPIPEQKRYQGSFDRASNHGYEYYHQMFNDRQLLLLGRLISVIDDISNQNIKEFLLLTFSNMLESNNMFCMYRTGKNHLAPIYNNNLITPRHTTVENNIWGAEYGRGTFRGMFDKIKAGKKWCEAPVEKYMDEDGNTQDHQMQVPLKGDLVDEPDDLGKNGNTYLRCGTSEYLPVDDEKVDAVITDPPYYDKEMYSELSDFYYVWLKQVLEKEYGHFQGNLTPKVSEAVVDPKKDVEEKRTKEHYINTLTNIFEESRRVLKDDGIMVFTFHHEETDAWGSTLQSVLDAEFYISALYPVNSETQGGTRHGRATIEYDTVIVCRKRETSPEKVSWRSLEDDIYFRAEEEIERLERAGNRLSSEDVFVVTMGKCLEEYSQHYPNIERDGNQMGVIDAVEAIQDIVDDQLLEERIQVMSDEMDELSAMYITYVLGKGDSIPYTTLNKALRQRGVDVDELIAENLVARDGNELKILEPSERASSIEKKSTPLAIDEAHYLRYLYEEDRLAQGFGNWSSKEAINALQRLAEVEGDDEYADIAEYIENHSDEQRGITDYT
jgi:adenine-specific DNA methylase